ncbi:outer membrane beta-barrel protein [Saccharicrinis aurantiacus]|uniref:outer membrane beta-barrel protein n=1 Tax=Saccharicrinis aurantiacus TaxID=1849719 RepID=UPI0009F9F0A0|nr:outer membrane beta-barrel protein [Saccharicrinis aurantiacus]
MKKLIVSLCIIGLMSTYAFAQPQSGIKIGTNTSFVNNTNEFDYKPQLGLGISYQHAFSFTDSWHLTLGAGYNMYSTSATSKTDNYGNIPSHQSQTAEYLSVPIAINYTFNKFYLRAGYQYGYKIDVSLFVDEGVLQSNPHDHSALIGIGYNLGFVNLELEYTSSLNQSRKGNGYSYYDGGSTNMVYSPGTRKLNVLQASVSIPLGKKRK